jgi:hypothetical protein
MGEGNITLFCRKYVKAHEPWKTISDTKLRSEALISSFKTKEWSRQFRRWILVEHEDTRT